MTIVEAIKKAMFSKGTPMTADEAYAAIVEEKLYEFHSDDAAGIVRRQIRRYCLGLDFTSASPTKHFRIVADGRYEPLLQPMRAERSKRRRRAGLSKETLNKSSVALSK